ncbi:MAG: hypothetical protein HQK78_00480 [Desulfobacterales bacterium]|nr:hypothetical protein [Desulfobacterales bacterium]
MNKSHSSKIVWEGEYIAEVDVEIVKSRTGWHPYLRVEDAQKLDEVREALRCGDIQKAQKIGRIFKVIPIAA